MRASRTRARAVSNLDIARRAARSVCLLQPCGARKAGGKGEGRRAARRLLSRKRPPLFSPLSIEQRPFSEEGFASTVWDSAIVLSKYCELQHNTFAGKRCVELGSGCGLLSAVVGRLGAACIATDLLENLPLLRSNLQANHVEHDGVPPPRVRELRWGAEAAQALLRDDCEGKVDFVLASDIMYVHSAVSDLVATLDVLCSAETMVLLAHGRNRPAEASFLAAVEAAGFTVSPVPEEALHETYRCLDVSVMKLQRTAAT